MGMGGGRSGQGRGTMSEINVTPLVDVVLVLLIIFMVTAPMMSRGIDVALPVATQTENPPEDRLTVTIKADGRVYISDRPVNLVLLEDTLRGLVASRASGKVVMLHADESLRYGRVIEVVDKIKNAGVEQIGFAYVLPDDKKKK